MAIKLFCDKRHQNNKKTPVMPLKMRLRPIAKQRSGVAKAIGKILTYVF